MDYISFTNWPYVIATNRLRGLSHRSDQCVEQQP
jgi:hypothetical protein